jgi:hypothetical protein
MASHTLRLVYDGLGATQHKMPPRYEKQITTGAQEFLGAHAYFFTEGRVPSKVSDHSHNFCIDDIRQKDGCWEANFAINILGIFVGGIFLKKYAEELTNPLAVEAARATKFIFAYLIQRSYRAWQERRPLRERTFDRIEPVLSERGGNGAPIFDVEPDRQKQRRRLFERVNSSMEKITAPIGYAAAHVDIWLDDLHLDHRNRRFCYSEDEISAALLSFRSKLEQQRRL